MIMRTAIMLSALVWTLSCSPVFAGDKAVNFLLPEGVKPFYVQGKKAVTQYGKDIDVTVAIGSDLVGSKDKVILAVLVQNKTQSSLNLDDSTISVFGDDKEPLHIYTKAELEKLANRKDGSRRLWHGVILGLGSAGSTTSTSSTDGTFGTPGQMPSTFSATTTTSTTYRDPVAEQKAIETERARLDAARQNDMSKAVAGLVPVTIAQGTDGGSLLSTDLPKKGFMMIQVKAGQDVLQFVMTVN
jgi:hypothetical protein